MASGKHEHAQVISEKGAIPLFARLLNSPHDQIKEQVFCFFFSSYNFRHYGLLEISLVIQLITEKLLSKPMLSKLCQGCCCRVLSKKINKSLKTVVGLSQILLEANQLLNLRL